MNRVTEPGWAHNPSCAARIRIVRTSRWGFGMCAGIQDAGFLRVQGGVSRERLLPPGARGSILSGGWGLPLRNVAQEGLGTVARSAQRGAKVVPLAVGVAESEGTYRTWMHEPFLERMTDERYRERAAYTLAAFLVMRLVDRYSVEAGYTHPEALEYQENGTLEFVARLDQDDAEAGHLMELIRVSKQVRTRGKRKLLWAPLLAYAHWLEQELRLEEALDVVETALRMSDGTAPEKEVAALLQQARILRLMGHFGRARDLYKSARDRAEAIGDAHSGLLARIGDAIVLRQKGNLPGSERALRKVLDDAERLGDQDAQARAHHDLGVAAGMMGRRTDAVAHFFEAFQRYRDRASKLRALSDLAEEMKRIGRYEPARNAFWFVLRSTDSLQVKARVLIALLEIASLQRDPLGFGRYGEMIREIANRLPLEQQVDFHLQLAVGYSRFGKRSKATAAARNALQLAARYGLNQYVFEAERLAQQLKNGPAPRSPTEGAGPGPGSGQAASSEEALVQIEEHLMALATE